MVELAMIIHADSFNQYTKVVRAWLCDLIFDWMTAAEMMRMMMRMVMVAMAVIVQVDV